MGFLRSRRVGNNFARKPLTNLFMPQAEQQTRQGQEALSMLLGQLMGTDSGAGYDNFRRSIGYNNILEEAMRGVTSSSAARGLLASGSTARALQNRAGQLAQSTYGNYLGTLLQGAQAATSAGQNAARIVGDVSGYTRQGGFGQFLQNVGQLASGIGSLIPGGGSRG